VVIKSVAAVIEVSDGSERVRLRFDHEAGMSTVVMNYGETVLNHRTWLVPRGAAA